MAIVNVSLDTASRQAVITINGILVPSDEFDISKWIDMDGNPVVSFGYTIDNVDGHGMKERRHFSLPSPEELATQAHSELDENGLASKVVHNDDKAKADTIDFIKHNRKVR